MIASVLHLSRSDIQALKINNAYALHIAVYQLFADNRSDADKLHSKPSGILYADKGGDAFSRKILMLSSRQPNLPEHGTLEMKKIAASFLDYAHYRFEVVVNPTQRANNTRKLIPLKNRQAIAAWFIDKAPQWGFSVSPEHLEVRDINVQCFQKKGQTITQAQAKLIGRLTVTDKATFVQSFQKGIGRGRAFGCGLLQIVPL